MLQSMAAVIMSVMDRPFQLALEESRSYAHWCLVATFVGQSRVRSSVAATVKHRGATYEDVL